MNALEQFEIYRNFKQDNNILINEKLKLDSNVLFWSILTTIEAVTTP